MKKLFLILFFFIHCIVNSQTLLKFDDVFVNNHFNILKITINESTYFPNTKNQTIYPNVNKMDTIIIYYSAIKNYKIDTIYSKFLINEQYLVSPTFHYDANIIRLSSIVFFEHGSIKLNVINKPQTDTLIFCYGLIMNLGQMITDNHEYNWISAFQSEEAAENFISVFIFLKKGNVNIKYYDELNNIINLPEFAENDWILLKEFKLLLFNNEKIIINYDYKSNIISF